MLPVCLAACYLRHSLSVRVCSQARQRDDKAQRQILELSEDCNLGCNVHQFVPGVPQPVPEPIRPFAPNCPPSAPDL
eukprot:9171494-Alexandrium_andersonii.AAC.1